MPFSMYGQLNLIYDFPVHDTARLRMTSSLRCCQVVMACFETRHQAFWISLLEREQEGPLP